MIFSVIQSSGGGSKAPLSGLSARPAQPLP